MKTLLIILSALILLNFSHLFYLNIFTHSLPHGVYIRVDGLPERDSYAATCLTPEIAQYGINRGYLVSGACETGSVLVLKKIKGMPGDYFQVNNRFLELNGEKYPLMNKDSLSRSLKLFYSKSQGILKKGQYMLLSDFVKNSWDSRYWGPVSIEFLLKPLWIFEKVK